MKAFETYKHNLDVDDKFGVKDINIDKKVNYRGSLKLVNKHLSYPQDRNQKIPPLAAAVLGLNNTDAPLPTATSFYNAWTDIDAQELFLNAKPTCFLILGKPGVGAYTIGESLSKKLNCIHLCPRNVIIDELEQKSPTGKCMDFNMRHNKVCKYDTILPILKEKMKSPAVQHRGYVMSGLPLVTTRWSEKYLTSNLSCEEPILEAESFFYELLVNMKKKKKKKHDDEAATSVDNNFDAEEGREEEEEEQVPEEENVEEEEEHPVELPKFLLEPCSGMISSLNATKPNMTTKKIVLLEQFIKIMDLPMKPDIIIYITCTDADAVSKKQNTYLNYGNASTIYKSLSSKTLTDLRWPIKCDLNVDYVVHQDSHTSNSKYYCRQPMNYKENSIDQLCNFRSHLLSFIERNLEQFNPANVIKLDGCLQVYQMTQHISERLLLLSVSPVCIPEPMYLEDPSDDMDEFWQSIQELNVIQSNNINFNRFASPWYNRCPVELKKRQSKSGIPKFAVTFLKHVYLMATLPSLIQFCRNPRPFLKLTYLEPTCRAIVVGTKSSGKTMICKCLEWLFDACYIDFIKLCEDERIKKEITTKKRIFSEIYPNIQATRQEDWQEAENKRLHKLDDWYNLTLKNLKKYAPLLAKYLANAECYCCVEEEEIGEHEERVPPLDLEFLSTFQKFRDKLLYLPFVNDVQEIKKAIADKDTLIRLGPDNLITPTVRPALPVEGDEDVTDAIEANIVANLVELEPTPEELVTELSKTLDGIDQKTSSDTCNEAQYGKWVIDNFPSDPEYWGLLSNLGFMPDYTIALIENRAIELDLVTEYKTIANSLKHYEERFLLANDPLIKTKLLMKKPSLASDLNVKIILHQYQAEVFNNIFNNSQDPAADAPDLTEDIAKFTEAIEKFQEHWTEIQTKVEEGNKCHIIIELEDKTDVVITEEMLLKLRQCYCLPCVPGEPEEVENLNEDEDSPKDATSFNLPYFLCDTNIYCPIAYYDYGVLWEGKPEFSIKYNNKLHMFSSENCLNEIFPKDVTKYQSYNKPFKVIPGLRICVIGCIGSGKTTISKYIAKELGLIHVDFVEFVNEYLIPRHFKRIGRKYENSFTDSSPEEENAPELQIDEENLENLEADLLSNETEFRRMLNNYFEQGSPLMSMLLQKMLKKLWFQKPFSSTGFVLDGFPRMLTDVEDMVAAYCIPDLVFDISCGSDDALARNAPQMFKTWKAQQAEAKSLTKMKFDKEKSEWFAIVSQKVVCPLILNEIIDAATASASVEEGLSKHPSTESNKMEPTEQESDLEKLYNEVIQEHPEPIDLSTWEKPSDARERIEGRIEGIYEIDDGNIDGLRDFLEEQKIKTVPIDNIRPLNKTLRKVSDQLSIVRNRCESFLEQTFILDFHVAESLLLEGFYFVSKFNRMCPVYIYENPETIMNPYKVMKAKGMIYTVAHRCYIYYISGKDNLNKFRLNPLKYVVNNNITRSVQYPLRLSVIGPPKCGKSTLAMKLAKKYGLMCLSRGKVIRQVIENMHWTELANKMMQNLSEGKPIGTDLILKAVQTFSTDPRTVTNGCVFDGFPDNVTEAMELSNMGLYPLIIFDLSADKMTILENSQKEVYFDIIKYKPPYARSFIEERFINWARNCTSIRNFVKEDIQNLYVLNANVSRWQCLQDALKRIDLNARGVYRYLNKVHSNVVPAGVMCVSNEAFKKRMSCYRNLCPICLAKNVLRHSDFPVDKTGVLEYGYVYYWVCPEHMNCVLNNPKRFLVPVKVDVPEIPALVKTVNPSLVYENGICIVTYAENLPALIIVRGCNEYAASYHGNTYLLCSANCLKKFVGKPQLYYNIVIFKDAKMFPALSVSNLPHLGYLEQTVGDIITEACCSVNMLRPKYPGLNIKVSGLLYIALYFKAHNIHTDKEYLSKYLKPLATYEARCKLMISVGLRLRSIDNPFTRYPVCHHSPKTRWSKTELKSISEGGSGDALQALTIYDKFRSSRVPVPDERYDFLVEYHKPASKVPAFLNVVDIAGLVKGAAEGQGLGNAFLSHIKACDAIFNLCRAFDDEDVIHVDGEVNPVRDLETISEELRLKDEEQLLASLDKLERNVNRGTDKKLKPEYDALLRIKAVLVDEKKHIRFGDWSAADIEILNKYLFITSKPALYLVNLSEKDYIRKKNKWLPKLKEWIDKNDPGAPLVPFSGVLETKLMDMEPAERQAFLKEHGITSALDKIIVQGYKALQLEYFFTAGADEVKAWIVQKGTKAPQAAGRIHTDFEKGFIMAEVMHYKDFKEEGSEAACKSAGKYRQQGRNYTVEDGDIIFFKFNAGAGLKDAKKK